MIKKTKFLVLCHELIMSGGLLRFERIGRELNKRGHELCFVCLSKSNHQHWHSNFPVFSIHEIKDKDWDVIMVPGAGFPVETMKAFSYFTNFGYAIRIQHVLNSPFSRDIRQRFLLVNKTFKPDILLFNNTHWAPGSYTDFTAKRFMFLEGGVDTDFFQISPKKNLNGNFRVIGGLASKNANPIIKALKMLPDNYIAHLYGPIPGDLMKCEDSIISDRIKLSGVIEEKDLPFFYHNCDCVVHTEEYAGWSNLGAEALSSGIPLICTEHGTKAFAKHEETALLIKHASPGEISYNIQKLFGDDNLRFRLIKQGREVIQKFSWSEYTQKLLEICEMSNESHYVYAPEIRIFGKWPISTRLKGLDKLLDNCKYKSIIDFGAAEGIIAYECLKRGARLVHGFELDGDRVEIAKRVCKVYSHATFRVFDLSMWDHFFTRHNDMLCPKYDIVLFLGIQHHLDKELRDKIIKDLALLAGEHIFIRTPKRVFKTDNTRKLLEDRGFTLTDHIQGDSRELGDLFIFKTDGEKNMFIQVKDLIFKNRFVDNSKKKINRYLVSFPKSGRTWIRYALYLLDLEKEIMFHHDGFEYNDANKPDLNFNYDSRLNRYNKNDRIVYLHRDPRDILVSLFHQITGRFKDIFNYQGDISDFIRDEYFGAINVYQFQKIWEDLCSEKIALKASYEDCHKDFFFELRKIIHYYEFNVSDEKVMFAAQEATFDKMRSVENLKSFKFPWLQPRNSARKVRRGIVGGYKDVLNEGDIRYLNQLFNLT